MADSGLVSKKTFAVALTLFLAITALISNGRDLARHCTNGFLIIHKTLFPRRFLTSIGCSGRLGNQIYRLISLYGIGRTTRRIPIVPSGCDHVPHLFEVFPVLKTAFDYRGELPPVYEKIDFGFDGGRADDKRRLKNITSPYIALTGEYLQSYKYFNDYREDVLRLLTCSQATMAQVEASAIELFRTSKRPKNVICVFIRRMDFVGSRNTASETSFTGAALQYVIRRLSENGNSTSKTSAVFLGDDVKWAKANFGSVNGTRVYHREMHSAEVDLCFGMAFCDTVLLTSSDSTFGFIAAYGRKNLNSVFYPHKSMRFKGDRFFIDTFPDGWIPLNELNGTVVEAEFNRTSS